MNFMYLDLSLLIIFLIFISTFLIRRRKKIKRDGLLYLYHTKKGVKLIERIGRKYPKFFRISSYFSVGIGYFLMVLVLYMFFRMVWLYVFNPLIVEAVKVPPITPLIPYLPQIFSLDFLPPFYFSYWIVILGIIAITHEFFHGIYAAHNKVKTKTTGFGFFPFFLPIFQAAFVELDEKVMNTKNTFAQKSVLSAGTFANFLTGILGILIMWGFFSLTFTASGVIFNDYAYGVVNISEITSINGVNLTNPSYEKVISLVENSSRNEINIGNESFFGIKAAIPEKGLIGLYYNSPALRTNLSGAITKINGEKISSLSDLTSELSKYSVGETIVLSIYNGEKVYDQNITLEESPEGKAWIGISFSSRESRNTFSHILFSLISYQNSNIYYAPSFGLAEYIYDMLWWLVLISFSVALINMLPMGMFDGGRFFFLTVSGFTKSEKIAEKSYKIATGFLLFLVFVIMFFWALALF